MTRFDGLSDVARIRDVVVDALRERGEVRVIDLDGVVVDPVDRVTLRVLVLPGLRASGAIVVDGVVADEARVRLGSGGRVARRPSRFVDLAAVVEARARLDELAREHPELCSPDAQARAAAWLVTESNSNDDDEREDKP